MNAVTLGISLRPEAPMFRLLLSLAVSLSFTVTATAAPKSVILLIVDDLGLEEVCLAGYFKTWR
jgi:hypothetical protein